jgi:hypothetical protein
MVANVIGSNVQASYIALVNGQVVKEDEIKAKYDGKRLTVDVLENGKHFYKTLNNKEIERVLTKHAHKMPLEQRLQRDFGLKGTKTRRFKKKGQKNKKRSQKKKSQKKKSQKKSQRKPRK